MFKGERVGEFIDVYRVIWGLYLIFILVVMLVYGWLGILFSSRRFFEELGL